MKPGQTSKEYSQKQIRYLSIFSLNSARKESLHLSDKFVQLCEFVVLEVLRDPLHLTAAGFAAWGKDTTMPGNEDI